MAVQQLHHVAYRCNDAKETADFYTKLLGLEYYAAVSEDTIPSTGEKCLYMHIFFAMADGSVHAVSVSINTLVLGYMANRRDGQTIPPL